MWKAAAEDQAAVRRGAHGRGCQEMSDDRTYMDFELPELDTEHDPSGGALRGIVLAWGAVMVTIAGLVLWAMV